MPAHKVILCIEANATVGFGHLVRCAAILNQLSSDCELTLVGDVQDTSIFKQAVNVVACSEWQSMDWVAMGISHADVVLVDLPLHRAVNWSCFRKISSKVVAVDDYGGDIDADVIVNGSVIQQLHHDPKRSSQLICAGPDYALVRPDFAMTPWKAHLDSSLCMVIGSGQPALEWAFFLVEQVAPLLKGSRLSMVVGGGFARWDDLLASCRQQKVNLCRHLSAAEMAEVLANASLVLATAGMIVYESVVVGVPLMAYPQLPEMKPEAEWFAQQQACITIEVEAWDAQALSALIKQTVHDHDNLRRISSIQRQIMDGQGVKRVSLLIDQWLTDEKPLKMASTVQEKNT